MGSCASTRVKSAQDVLGHDAERNPGLSRRHRKTSRGKTEAKTVGDDEVNSCLGRRGTSDTAASAAAIGATKEFATKSSREVLGSSRKNGQHLDSVLNSCFYLLPVELLRSGVLTFLSAPCLVQAGMTCVTWRDAAVDESLWKSLCLGLWAGKHLALLDGLPRQEGPRSSQGGKDETSDSRVLDADEQKRRELIERVGRLHGGLEDLVAAMTIKSMKRRLEELGANPRRLASCLEKGECVSLVMGSMLLSREGLLREGGQLPPWVSSMRGWRWSYYFAKVDARRCWLTMDDLVRSPWTMSFPADRPTPTSPLLIPSVTCEFHRDFSYTDEGFHQLGLDWHFEDSHRCVKVSNYPALEAERDASWGWRLVNSHVVFEQQRRLPSPGGDRSS